MIRNWLIINEKSDINFNKDKENKIKTPSLSNRIRSILPITPFSNWTWKGKVDSRKTKAVPMTTPHHGTPFEIWILSKTLWYRYVTWSTAEFGVGMRSDGSLAANCFSGERISASIGYSFNPSAVDVKIEWSSCWIGVGPDDAYRLHLVGDTAVSPWVNLNIRHGVLHITIVCITWVKICVMRKMLN